MLIIHFVREDEDQPVCRRPERRDWLWAADPAAVTCPACVPDRADALPPPTPDRAGAPAEPGADRRDRAAVLHRR